MNHNNSTQCGLSALLLVLLLITVGVSFHTTAGVTHDPWEPINRKVHAVNSALDQILLKPVVEVYDGLTPNFVEVGVTNFFANLNEVNHLFNHCMQLNINGMAIDTARLLINSTFGLAGVVEVATNFGLYRQPTDFGHTLGLWKVPSGPYLVIPLFGSSTLRDGVAMILDARSNPLSHQNTVAHQAILYGLQMLDVRRQMGDFDTGLSDDGYVFVREAYLQQRQYLILGVLSEDQFDDF